MATKRQLRERWTVEPGLTIRQRVIDFERGLQIGHDRRSDELFRLLQDLPYRDEVPGGRDFRGSDFAGSVSFDLSESDFSYSHDMTDFLQCNLTNARFDEVVTDHTSFHKTLHGASFQNAKLRSCHITECDARNCCFDGANIRGMNFQRTDLTGSSFRDANCKGACFYGADLRGCDFRGAILESAVFEDTKIDKTTNLRGASLINAYHDDHVNNAGVLIGRGVDLRQATFDDTTKFGDDPLMDAIEIWDALIEVARRDYGQDGWKIASIIERIKREQIRAGTESLQWKEELFAKLTDRERKLYEQIEDDAARSLR